MKWLATLLTLALAMVLAPAVHASGVIGLPVTTCIAEATPGTKAAAMFRADASFDCTSPQKKFGTGDYWVRSGPLDPALLPPRRMNVRINSLWQDAVTLHALYPDGRIFSQRLDGQGASRNLQLGAVIQWTLPDATQTGKPVQLLWKVEGSANLRGILHAPTIATNREAAHANLTMGAIYAGFAGLCSALLIYNLAMYGALRHRFQLSYCGMVFALLLYAGTSSGALAWAEPGIFNNDRLRLNYALLALAAIAAMHFARTFFEERVYAGYVRKLANAASIALGVSALLFCIVAPWHIQLFETIYSLSYLLLIAAVIPIVVRARIERSPHLWLFCIAWAAPILFACMRILGNLALIPWNFWIDNSTILSMTFEAVMSSLAIAYRIRLLSRERDEARANEIAARLLADTDPLTGLLNRRSFLQRVIGLSGERRLLILDIDHFKRVNDTLGHDGGDEVLRVIARVLRKATPSDALIARIGGEEFAIVCDAATRLDPDTVLDELRSARMPFDLIVTASIGTCTGPVASEKDWKAMYRHADRALFDAKESGRDRVRNIGSVPLAA